MSYKANSNRYDSMPYRRCGQSGILLPAVSLGLWQNFGCDDIKQNCRDMLRTAFDLGITHFDLANNYGPPPGSAESCFGEIMNDDFKAYRDQLIISTKAGHPMWDGPYGNWGSKKYLTASLDQSLKRMNLDYVDIFYHHRPDPATPIAETMSALDLFVRQGKALYIGLSNYSSDQMKEALAVLKDLGTPCLIEQSKYSMFVRNPEEGLLDLLGKKGVGFIAYSPLAQGLLSDKYLNGIPDESRAARNRFLKVHDISEDKLNRVRALNEIATSNNLTLAQLAVNWLLCDERITSVLIGASRSTQIVNIVDGLAVGSLDAETLNKIEIVLK